MWHVDEGTLHAYLDERERGAAAAALDAETRARVEAHLASCAACAAQLADAARIRGAAVGVLRDASPAVEPFAFEELQRVKTAPRRTWVPLAWAATLVLAVGAGWIGSQLWRNGPQATSSPSTPERSTAAAPAPAPEVEAAPPPAAQDARLATAEAPARAQEKMLDLPIGAAGGVAKAEPAAAPAAPAPVQDIALPPSSASNVLGLVAREASADAADADVAWKPVTKAEAERVLGGPLYAIEGEELTEVAVAADRVRVRQRTAAGVVELVQWRAPDALAALARRREVAAPMQLRAEAKAADLAAPRAKDAAGYVEVPGTTHPVEFRAPAGVDPATLLARVKPLPLEGAMKR